MPDTDQSTQAVTLTISKLSPEIAEQLVQAQSQDPELLRQIITYGISHMVVFNTLVANSWGTTEVR